MSSHSMKHGGGGSPGGGHGAPPKPQPAPPKEPGGRRKELRADFLLNFQRPPPHQRPQGGGGGGAGGGGYAPPPRRSRPSGRQHAPTAFVRGRFVQSSFRLFVDQATPDVVEAVFNADALIDWPNVRRVDLLCDEHPKCPICLEEDMVVPKITKCGHIFCVPCIMRYFLMLREQNGRQWQKCPVCNEQTVPEDLTSVRLQLTRPLHEGDRVSFVLAQRDVSSMVVRSSLSSTPRTSVIETRGDGVDEAEVLRLPSESVEGWHLSRVVRLANGEAARLLAQEVEALRQYRPVAIAEGDTELLPSIDAATALLEGFRDGGRGGDGRGHSGGGGGGGGEGGRYRAGSAGSVSSGSATGSPPRNSWGCCYVDVDNAAEEFISDRCVADDDDLPPSVATEREPLHTSETTMVEVDNRSDDEVESDPLKTPTMRVADDPTASAGTSSLPSPAGVSAAGGVQTSPVTSASAVATPIASAAASPAMTLLPGPALAAAGGTGSSGVRTISFYQAGDGRLIFLQPFFTKLLLHEHGGRWDKLPAALPKIRVERIQEVTILEETRKRYRFLSHLPLGSPITLVEVDLRAALGAETKEHFREEFSKRSQWRRKEEQRTKREERHSKNRAAEQEEQYYRELNLTHPAMIIAPPTKEDFAVPLPNRRSTDAGSGEAPDDAAAEGGGGAAGGDAEATGPTLADKIKDRIAAEVRVKDRSSPGAFPQLPGSGATTGKARAARGQAGERGRASAFAGAPSSGSSAWGGEGRGARRAAAAARDNGGRGGPSPSAPSGGSAPPPGGEAVAAGEEAEEEFWDWEDRWTEEAQASTSAAAQARAGEEAAAAGQALEAALLRAASASSEVDSANAVLAAGSGEGEVAATVGEGAASGGTQKKKKGRAAKATTIRLFG